MGLIDLPTKSGLLKVARQQGGSSSGRPLLWVPGFLGTMTGAKVEHLESMKMTGNVWKFNYSQIGDSRGELTFKNWFNDAAAVLEHVYNEEQRPVVLVASSMGAFISLNLARDDKHRDKIAAMFLCAPARDFMRAQVPQLESIPGDMVPIPDTYLHSSGLPGMPKAFFETIAPFWIDDGAKLDIDCHVHILHPELDELCPMSGSHKLVDAIGSDKAKLEILTGAKHSMSMPSDLEAFERSLLAFYETIQ